MNIRPPHRTRFAMARLFSALLLTVYCAAGMLHAGTAAAEDNPKASTKRLPTYFPNTEELRPDEMRITALGTGLPTPITRAQKNSAWMVELGNGDVFLFDIGTGSMDRSAIDWNGTD